MADKRETHGATVAIDGAVRVDKSEAHDVNVEIDYAVRVGKSAAHDATIDIEDAVLVDEGLHASVRSRLSARASPWTPRPCMPSPWTAWPGNAWHWPAWPGMSKLDWPAPDVHDLETADDVDSKGSDSSAELFACALLDKPGAAPCPLEDGMVDDVGAGYGAAKPIPISLAASIALSPRTEGVEKRDVATVEIARLLEPREQADTTKMVRNLPRHYSQQELMKELNASGFAGKYDFVYMPCLVQKRQGYGFAFVNFLTMDIANDFEKSWSDIKCLRHRKRQRAVEVVASSVQGFEANVQNWADGKTCKLRDRRFAPLLLL